MDFLQSSELQNNYRAQLVRFEFLTAVTKKNAVFWDMTPCGSCNSRRFGGTYHLHHQGAKNQRARDNVNSNFHLKHAVVTANVVPSSPILVTLMMEAICSSESLVLTRRNIPEDGILYRGQQFGNRICFTL
jgi:hypothetical protein